MIIPPIIMNTIKAVNHPARKDKKKQITKTPNTTANVLVVVIPFC